MKGAPAKRLMLDIGLAEPGTERFLEERKRSGLRVPRDAIFYWRTDRGDIEPPCRGREKVERRLSDVVWTHEARGAGTLLPANRGRLERPLGPMAHGLQGRPEGVLVSQYRRGRQGPRHADDQGLHESSREAGRTHEAPQSALGET